MSWRSTSLGDCIELVSGAAFKSAMFTDNKDDIPLVKGENIGQGKILWDKSRYWPATQFKEYSKLILKPGDIVLAMDRPWVTAGLKYAIVSDRDPVSLLVQRVARIRPLPNADAKFLKHVIGSKGFLEYIKGVMGGTNVPHISGRQIRDFKCQLPDLETQQRIASILSAYDDLIENNRRRIALLEEAARQLYKEWFVRFRFPGHEHVKIIDGVPEGWICKTIEAVCDTIGGGTPSTKKPEYWDNDNILWFTPTDVTRNSCLALIESETKISETGLIHSSAKMIPAGSILMTSRASVGFFGINRLAASTNQGFINIVPHDAAFRMYILQNLMWRVEEIRSHAGGSTYKEISKGRFRALPILVPPTDLAREYEDQASSIHSQVEALHITNQQLAKARDLLLPKLMSGAIAV